MKFSEIGSSLFLMALGVFMAWQAEQLSLGTLHVPGPGFFPFYLALLLIGVSIIMFFMGVKARPEEREAGLRWDRVAVALTAIFIYALVLETVGYLLASFFLIVLLMLLMVKKAWWFAPAVACFISLASYVLFKVGLQALLPRGIFGF